MKKKYTIDFIEYPEYFDDKEMMKIIGGNAGLCIGFTTCTCNTDKKGTYSICEKEQPKSECKQHKEKYFMKKYKDTFCIIVTIKDKTKK